MTLQVMNSVNKGVALLSFYFFFIGTLLSQNITIRGTEPQYAGKEISFFTFSERILSFRQELGSCIVDEEGNFSISYNSIHTLQAFADLGKYQVYLYTEPGNKYHIKLPPRAEKSMADKLNPYFRQEVVHLGMIDHNPGELNEMIRNFDDAFAPIFRKYALKAYLQTRFSDLDSTLHVINNYLSNDQSTYFQCYVKYKTALLKEMSSKKKSAITIPDANFSTAVLNYNPAFYEWFNQVYRNYFQYLARLDPIQYPVHDIIDIDRNYHALFELLQKIGTFPNDTMTELILMKGLFDEYFSHEFDEAAILKILDSLIDESLNTEHIEFAQNMRYRLTRLKVGNFPPEFELLTFDNDTCTLNDLKGKYVYLNFCTSLSYSCLNHFALLKLLQEKYADLLVVVTVSVDEDNSRMKELIQTMGYSWKFLDFRNHSKIVEDYDVRAYPTYFLIDPQGKLALSPAPGPDKDFERYFVKFLRSGRESDI
jgi:peroxiredoxin